MPSLSSTITSTLTILVTVSSAMPQIIPSAIRGLSDCVQGVLFPLIANSPCNPADFQCVCSQLNAQDAQGAVAAACSSAELSQFQNFQVSTCGSNIAIVQQPPVFNITNTTTTAPAPAPVTTNGTAPAGPFNNATIAPTTTNVVVVPTTDSNGKPTTVVVPTAPGPVEPTFTGAAAAVEVPKFGHGRVGLVAAGMGLMGLMFAEL